jgi:Asp-tRNAAsn/Glu-tRNAGln amidotransferase A subunit and related amidases
MYLNDLYTVTANLAGIPGMSVPCGLTSTRLPIGFQLLALTGPSRFSFALRTPTNRNGRSWLGHRSTLEGKDRLAVLLAAPPNVW